MQRDFRARLGTTFAFLGDEIYLKAGRAIPSRKHYGEYPQIEDGIGMVRSFANDFESLMKGLRARLTSAANGLGGAVARPSGRAHQQLNGTILTGTLFAPVLEELVGRINEVFGSRLLVVPVANDYFGGDVSVAGLLTGGDFLAARDQVQGDFAIIPNVALKSDEPIFLDGMRFEELGKQFRVPVHAFNFEQFTSFLRTNLVRTPLAC